MDSELVKHLLELKAGQAAMATKLDGLDETVKAVAANLFPRVGKLEAAHNRIKGAAALGTSLLAAAEAWFHLGRK